MIFVLRHKYFITLMILFTKFAISGHLPNKFKMYSQVAGSDKLRQDFTEEKI